VPPDSGSVGLPEQVRDLIEKHQIEFVRVEQPDLHGVARSKLVTVAHLAEIAGKGLNFPLPPLALDVQCQAVSGSGYLAERGFPDTALRLDFDTLAPLPWVASTARVIADPYHAADGAPASAGSRHVARALVRELEWEGYQLLGGFEYEFYVADDLDGVATQGNLRQFGSFAPGDQALVGEIVRGVAALGIAVTTANLEYGPAQVEINFAPATGLVAADQAYTFKNAVKEIAAASGRVASFMTKPSLERSANGCHFNQSLLRDGSNAFADPEDPDRISALARHFLAGQLLHAPALAALYAPTINCSKRFRPNSFAPVRADWAIDDRSVAIRVKSAPGRPVHLENRLPTGASNPYLVLAGSIAAGLDGIRRRLEPPPSVRQAPADRRYETLPQRLEIALAALEQDAVLRAALGAEFLQVFFAVKRHEIEKARGAIADYDAPGFLDRVDPWERAEFLTVI
jgi:glutamine synthetase